MRTGKRPYEFMIFLKDKNEFGFVLDVSKLGYHTLPNIKMFATNHFYFIMPLSFEHALLCII